MNIFDDKSLTNVEVDTRGALLIKNSEDYICRPYQAHATHVAFDYYGTECIVNQVCFKKIDISANFKSFNFPFFPSSMIKWKKYLFFINSFFQGNGAIYIYKLKEDESTPTTLQGLDEILQREEPGISFS